MPIYEYECSKCHEIFEEWAKASESDAPCSCPQCHAPAERVISHTSFVLKGGGWYVTDYGYRKGVKENSAPSPAGKTASPAATPAQKPLAQKPLAPAAPTA